MTLTKKEAFKDVRLFALDMDGTVYLGNSLIEGALDFIHQVEDTGRKFIFFTNNSSRVPSFYKEKLAKMGCFVEVDQIITS
ncbi:MAG: HAD family hydrolase, partial [Eubacteriaceae bacterium]|nr:HAD family hydrolase [Eubacteriaceae bacterium]